jgi:putative FmdB family regulatory protein
MPIYAYKCGSCGHAKDVLQKISDAPLTACPACGASAFSKQVTAAGFQLKGSGWYATDFRGGTGATSAPAADSSAAKPADSTPAAPSTSSDAPTASAGSCSHACACH